MARESFPGTRWTQQARDGIASARSLRDRKQVKLRWKLFHREERPALERHIIDTSEWTCANHRCVIGHAFWFAVKLYERAQRTCDIVQNNFEHSCISDQEGEPSA